MTGPYAYLTHLLVWTLPVLAVQLIALFIHYRERSAGVLRAILPPALTVGAWLSFWDHLAIKEGIWLFPGDNHLGVYVGQVPLEEVLFFFITSLLVSFGLALFTGLFERRLFPEGGAK